MRHIHILLTMLIASLSARAQTITTLDWNELRIDSILPTYSEVVPLAKDYAAYTFDVKMEYATWVPLTPAEEMVARRFINELSDTINIYSHVGSSRGEGMLDIAFTPIIYDRTTETMKKLLQCKLSIMATPKARRAPRAAQSIDERWKRNSVLASGKWHKIAIENDGIYALTPAFLQRMGITDLSRVKVYGYGGRMLNEVINADTDFDDLEEIPLVRNARNGNLLFWGYGTMGWNFNETSMTNQHHTVNPYSTLGYYFITEDDNPAVLETEPEMTSFSGSTLSSFTAYVVRDIDEYCYFTGGRKLWENKLLTGGRNYQLNTAGYSGGTATLRLSVANGSNQTSLITSSINDSTLTSLSVSAPGSYEYAGSGTKYFVVRGLKDGINTLTISSTQTDTRLDYIELSYPHAFKMMGSTMPFTLLRTGNVRFKLTTGVGQDVVLMRLGKRGSPATLISKSSDGYYKVADAIGDYVAFDLNADYNEPTLYVGLVSNQNLHSDEPVNMVIITPASGIQDTNAQRLADAHAQYDGTTCRVVRADKIYNEFSSGTPDATAYRRYMKMLYDRALANGQEPPRNLLLFGDCVWDNRLLSDRCRNLRQEDLLLCFESVNSLSDTQSYVMEDYFGLLDDGEGSTLSSDKSDIGIGRFPVRTAAEGYMLTEKTIDHLLDPDPGKWQNLAIFLGDDGDNNDHMDYANQVAEAAINTAPGMDSRKVMWDSYKRVSTTTGNGYPLLTQYINETVNSGAIMINYVGHGCTYMLSHENVLSLADVRGHDNKRQGFWFTAACDIMPFDGLEDNIGEASIMNVKGGSKCFIGTARTVYANHNLNLNRAFNKVIFNCDPTTGRRYSIGEALRLAKNQMSERGTTVNKLQYAILGDPSLVFGQPKQQVVIDSINGIKMDEAAPQVKAGSRCRISGHIEDARGNRIDDFYGLLDSRIMDAIETETCLNQDNASKAFQYKVHKKVLYEGTDSVRNGKFDLSFVVPMDINYANDNGRGIFYAQGRRSDGTWLAANGFTNHYIVGGSSTEMADDKTGPKIDLWLESESFVNGARVSTSPMLYAKIEDESGMNYSSAGLGHGLEISIDEKADLTFDVSKAFVFDGGSAQSGRLEYQLPVLSRGEHSLKLRAWDVLNNTSTATITFRVDGTNESAPISAFVDSGTNHNAVVTIINRLTGQTTCDATIHLFDATGRLCFTTVIDGISSGETIRTSIDQGGLTSGIYFLQVTMNQGGKTYQSEIQKVILNF